VDATAINTSGERLHRTAYISLRDGVHAHILSRAMPHLGELPKPLNFIPSVSTQTQCAFDAAGEVIANGKPSRSDTISAARLDAAASAGVTFCDVIDPPVDEMAEKSGEDYDFLGYQVQVV
jgi:hypothetical protein